MVTKDKAKTAAAWTTKTAGELGDTAYHALQDSLDAAAGAARLLRGDLGPQGRESMRRIETLVRDAQRDLRRTGQQVLAELQAIADRDAGDETAAKPSRQKPKATPRAGAAKAAATKTPSAPATAAKATPKRPTRRPAQGATAAKPRTTRAKRA